MKNFYEFILVPYYYLNFVFVIYLATCQRCKGQYVGKSQTPFKRRHSNHKQEIKKKIGIWGTIMGVMAVVTKTSKFR